MNCVFCKSAPKPDPELSALCQFCQDHVPEVAFKTPSPNLTVQEFWQLLAKYHNTARVTGDDLARIMGLKIFGEENGN